MSKKAKFRLVLALNLVLLTLSALLKYTAVIGFVFSTLWWWEKEHAFERKEGVTTSYNSMKRTFASFGRLDAYHKTTTVLYYISLIGSLIGFVVESLSAIETLMIK